MKDLLDYIVKSLVSKPDAVKISEENLGNAINFNLTIAPEDMGMVIGKSGQTIRSIRKLLIARAMAESEDIRVTVNLLE